MTVPACSTGSDYTILTNQHYVAHVVLLAELTRGNVPAPRDLAALVGPAGRGSMVKKCPSICTWTGTQMSQQAAIPQHDWRTEMIMAGNGLMAQVPFCTTTFAKDHDPTTPNPRQAQPWLKPTPTTETAAAAPLTVRTSNYHFTTSAVSRRYEMPFNFSHVS